MSLAMGGHSHIIVRWSDDVRGESQIVIAAKWDLEPLRNVLALHFNKDITKPSLIGNEDGDAQRFPADAIRRKNVSQHYSINKQ